VGLRVAGLALIAALAFAGCATTDRHRAARPVGGRRLRPATDRRRAAAPRDRWAAAGCARLPTAGEQR
jgi:hypothetical protein